MINLNWWLIYRWSCRIWMPMKTVCQKWIQRPTHWSRNSTQNQNRSVTSRRNWTMHGNASNCWRHSDRRNCLVPWKSSASTGKLSIPSWLESVQDCLMAMPFWRPTLSCSRPSLPCSSLYIPKVNTTWKTVIGTEEYHEGRSPEGDSEVQSKMFRFSTMPEINWCKVINLIHNRHFSTHRPNIIYSLYTWKNRIIFIKTFIKKSIPMKNRKGRPATAPRSRAMHEQVVTRAWIVESHSIRVREVTVARNFQYVIAPSHIVYAEVHCCILMTAYDVQVLSNKQVWLGFRHRVYSWGYELVIMV